MLKILLIDDDIEVLRINHKFLMNEGFKVYSTNIPDKGIHITQQKKPDCIILDIMMPHMNGYEICRKIHSFTDTPIIFLTGCDSENDKINGLTLGADDYIVKPYSLHELKARIHVIVRRSAGINSDSKNSQLIFNDLVIDKLKHKAYYRSEDLLLANREYETLLYLAEHPNQVVSFEELGTSILGSFLDSDRRLIMVIVSRLRKKLAGYLALENMLETVWSVGYKLVVNRGRSL
ncbi:MAG: response regulator transcription factor [Anaerocolumna sp.]